MLRHQIRCDGMPLAVYREVAAHLAQIEGVKTELVPQPAQEFHYHLSQIDSLWIEYPDKAEATCRERVQQILAYYGDRYGAWETVEKNG